MDYRKIDFWQLVLLAFLLTFIAQLIHEAGHWAVYEALGLGPIWGFSSLVQVWGKPPLHPGEWITITAPNGESGWLRLVTVPSKTEESIMLAAGPLASLLGVIFGLCLMRWNSNSPTKQMGLILALIGSITMSQHYLRGFSGTSGDEYFLAAHLGIPIYIINIPLGLAFIITMVMGFWVLGEWRIRLKWVGAILLGSIPSGIFLMKANALVITNVNQGNQLFQSLLGWSFPVLVVNAIAFIAILFWWKREKNIRSLNKVEVSATNLSQSYNSNNCN
jgi:hypothetical protein